MDKKQVSATFWRICIWTTTVNSNTILALVSTKVLSDGVIPSAMVEGSFLETVLLGRWKLGL